MAGSLLDRRGFLGVVGSVAAAFGLSGARPSTTQSGSLEELTAGEPATGSECERFGTCPVGRCDCVMCQYNRDIENFYGRVSSFQYTPRDNAYPEGVGI